jgi:hypothetical protein
MRLPLFLGAQATGLNIGACITLPTLTRHKPITFQTRPFLSLTSILNPTDRRQDEKERIKHAHAIQQIIHDEATQIPLFEVPYFRLAYWGWIKFPNPPSTRLTDGFEHFDPSTGGTHWIDKKTKKDIQNAKRSRKKLAPVTRIERTYEKVMSKS